jgi:nucleoid-associated protein YgaU
MSRHRPARRDPSRPLSIFMSALLCASLFIPPAPLRAQDPQDVAEAARKERARKAAAAQQKKESHVYTNDDLKQSKILTDEDQVRVDARKNGPANPGNAPAIPSFDAENSPAPDSLGEVARRYRREKAAREAEEAAKSLSPSLFQMDLTRPALATPVEPSAPLAPPKLVPFKYSKPVMRVTPSSKRDPFSPPMASPSLRNMRPDLSSNLPVPSKPSLPSANVAPHAPAVRVVTPEVPPSLGVSPAAVSAPVQPSARRTPQRPVVAPPLSTNAPAMPKTHTAPASAPNLLHSVSPDSAPSFSSQAKPMAPQALPHTDITAPMLPNSHVAPAPAPAPRLEVHGAQNAVPPSLASHAHPAIPATNAIAGSALVKPAAHTSNVAPALPKSHVSSAIAPKLNVPAASGVPLTAEVAPPAPLASSEFEPSVVSASPIAHTAPLAPFLPKSRHVIALEPSLVAPSVRNKMPAPLAPVSSPVQPAIAAHTEIVAPALPSSNIAPAPAPNLLLPSAPDAVPSSFAPSAAKVAPISTKSNSKTETLLVQFGDSLWKLARRRFGRGSRWSEFLASNPAIVDPNLLQPGTVLVVPNTELLLRVQPPNSITVRTGDSLWKLAAAHLGQGSAWTCIAAANPQLQNANLLQPGQLLTLPTSCSK